MRVYSRRLVLLAIIAVLAVISGIASANRLSVSNGSIRTGFSLIEITSGGATIRCDIAVSGSFHATTFAKTEGALVGVVTAAEVWRPCAAGTVWTYNGTERNEVLGGAALTTSLPWHLTYRSFAGTLPNITSVRWLLAGARLLFRTTVLGITLLCVYTTGATNGYLTMSATLASRRVESLRVEGAVRSETGGFCPTYNFSAEFSTVTLASAPPAISVSLI